MLRYPLLFASGFAALCLTACSKEKEPQEKPSASAQAAAVEAPQPGKYRTTIKVTAVKVPGIPDSQAGTIRNMFGASGQSVEFCLTSEEAGKGFRNFSSRAAQGDCSYDSFSAGNGKMDAVMSCKTGQGMSSKSELHGEFSATGSHLVMKTDGSVPGLPGGIMHMEAEVTNQRIGDCA